MFLKSLTLKGFKSFAEPTTLDFEPGVTVVVGPNGSGKSNVVDAVAWVLGAQGPSTVRSAKMEDVIFAGSPQRPALGRAEVSLTIDNSAGLLPIEFSEVTISRTLFRTGESEYAINRVPCRLLDIQELLSDTGVGRQQHVIVSQGNLDAVLNSRSEDRRLVIEEAAGVLKFRRRKERAERRLESTEASLVRLQDLLREVRRQLRPLEKQAEAARRHGDLVTELTAVQRYLLGRDLAAVESRLAAARRDRAELGRVEDELRGALAALDADVVAAEAELEGARAGEPELDLVEAVSRAEAARARAGGLVAVLAERNRSLVRALSTTIDHDVIAALEAEAAGLHEGMTAVDDEANRLIPWADELAEAESALAADARRVDEEWEHGSPAGADAAAAVRGELAALKSSSDRAGEESRRLETRMAGIERRVARLDNERGRLGQIVDDTGTRAASLVEEERIAAATETATETRLDAAAAERREADAEHHRWTSRADTLAQALDQARARAGAERLAETAGFLGALLELVAVDDGYEAAFEAAAGAALGAVVVDSIPAARESLTELHRGAVPGAVVALPDLGPHHTDGSGWRPLVDGVALNGSAGWLRTRVQARLPSVGAWLDELLVGTVVVEGDWVAAADLAIAHPELVVVTRTGDRCAHRMWQLGAGSSAATGAAVEEARDRAAEASARAAAAELVWQNARRDSGVARAEHERVARAVEANVSRRRAALDARQRVEVELAEATSEHSVAAAQQREAVERHERDRARRAELETLLPELDQQAEAEAERAAAERAARSALAQRSAAIAGRRRDLEVRAAGLEERRSMTSQRLRDVEERLQRNVLEREHAAARRGQLQDAVAATERLTRLVEGRQGELDALLDRLRHARRAQAEAVRQRTERVEHLRRQRNAVERQLAETRERSSRTELEAAEARVRLEGLTEAVRRDLDCEPDAVRGAECPLLPPGTSPSSRRTELDRELRLMGPINPLALEEHSALLERHQFLETQLEDVRAARRELGKVIRAVDAEIVEIFQAAYADVADNFELLFGTLFPGGQGRLRLTDPEHLLDTGIDVDARPSGKNIRRLSLLSGGERSLTAMAFLFAVFRSRPSPFYLMDEVEAALDDVNLHRFLELVDQFRSEAQLLIVTHQKRTMEAADCLYGVTMAPGGSSRVVSEGAAAPYPADLPRAESPDPSGAVTAPR